MSDSKTHLRLHGAIVCAISFAFIAAGTTAQFPRLDVIESGWTMLTAAVAGSVFGVRLSA